MPRPPLDPLTNIGHCPPPRLPATCSDSSPSRRQSSISYLPPDSPRLWSPRTPLTVSTSLERSSSLSGANSPKEGHSRTCSIPQRATSEPAVLTLAERCVSRTRVHSCMEQLKIHLFAIGMRISCNLSPRRSPSASSYVLSSRYTTRSSSNSNASGNASCASRVWAKCPLNVDPCFSCIVSSAQWLGWRRARAGSCHNKSSAHTIHLSGAPIIVSRREPRAKSDGVEFGLFDDNVLFGPQCGGQPTPLTVRPCHPWPR